MQVTLAFGCLIGVVGSAVAVEGLQRGTLRLLEGYWPRPLAWLRRYWVQQTAKHIAKKRAAWDQLAARYDRLTAEELETYVRLETELAAYPATKRLLPTRLGNRLRAAEDYAWSHYGLATGVFWSRLWLMLPDSARKEITEAGERLHAAVRLVIWSALFLVWTGWAWWWVVPISVVGIAWGYGRALEAAGVYGELLCAVFDLYRFTLYQALHWPRPKNPAEEHRLGRQLTVYLWRGWDQDRPTFET